MVVGTSINGSSVAVPQRIIPSASFVHRNWSKRQLGVLGADLVGGIAVMQPTTRMASRWLGVSEQYIRLGCTFSVGKRAAILGGWDTSSFSLLLTKPKPLLALPAPLAVSDDELIGIANVVGTERMLNAAAAAEHGNGHAIG